MNKNDLEKVRVPDFAKLPSIHNPARISSSVMSTLNQAAAAVRAEKEERSAVGIFRRAVAQIQNFEQELQNGESLAVVVGSAVDRFILERLTCDGSELIIFEGSTLENERVVCIQHFTQMNLQLIAIKTSAKRNPIGYVLPENF